MIIEISKHGINLGEDLEYISTYILGKIKKNIDTENFRILTKGVKTGKERFLFFSEEQVVPPSKFKSYHIGHVDEFKTISPDHIRVKDYRGLIKYDYYKLGYDIESVDKFFAEWRNSIPMVFTGEKVVFSGGEEAYLQQYITFLGNYTWAYKFNNKTY